MSDEATPTNGDGAQPAPTSTAPACTFGGEWAPEGWVSVPMDQVPLYLKDLMETGFLDFLEHLMPEASEEAVASIENTDGDEAVLVGPATSILAITDIVSLAESVKDAGSVEFLVSPLWPGDAYGVLGAEKKAGKTWADLDLAVSVALGLKWFGRFEVERPGSVVVYAGEGGARNIVRRVQAIAEHRGVPFDDLRGVLRVSERVPKLTDPHAMEAVREDLAAHPGTALVIIDPLYLAAAGAKGSDLYARGEALSGIQAECQDAGAALVVTTHWNKTGTGSGPDRFTGLVPPSGGGSSGRPPSRSGGR